MQIQSDGGMMTKKTTIPEDSLVREIIPADYTDVHRHDWTIMAVKATNSAPPAMR